MFFYSGEGEVATNPESPEPGTASFHDGINEPKGSIRRVNITRPGLRPQAGAVAREAKQGMKAVRPEVSSVLLVAVGRALKRRIDSEMVGVVAILVARRDDKHVGESFGPANVWCVRVTLGL
jgi:hypothetical protein